MQKLLMLALIVGIPGACAGATVTAYSDIGIMADGHRTHLGCCAGPRWVPLGTVVVIGGKRYTVTDRTALRFNGRYDVWMPSRRDCLRFGIRQLPVRILK